MKRSYIAIDLKSFYASVECHERGRDPLQTNLVVADPTRTDKTICLAVSPSLKQYGIPGRPRLFEVVEQMKIVNGRRQAHAPHHHFRGKSDDAAALARDASLCADYIVAPPRMHLYMEYSQRIYRIYLKYIAPEDIHIYSVDEVFIDATAYLGTYHMTAHDLALRMVREVLQETGITATAGIGTNLYLAKISMDIVAKHMPADKDGVRIAFLDERSYREKLWAHRPLQSFWRVGRGTAKKLARYGIFTMGDIARCSLGQKTDFYNEDLLYKLFGVNAELLIDHAWGWEPVTIHDIKQYKPTSRSLSSGQVLQSPYTAARGRLIVQEMTALLALDLVRKNLVTNQIVLDVGYDIDNMRDQERAARYHGPLHRDHYGRMVPKPAHGAATLPTYTASSQAILAAMEALYDRIVNPTLLVRRCTVTAANILTTEEWQAEQQKPQELDLFALAATENALENATEEKPPLSRAEKEKALQQTVLGLKEKYGKNAILRGMNLQAGATTIERNRQVGGHKA